MNGLKILSSTRLLVQTNLRTRHQPSCSGFGFSGKAACRGSFGDATRAVGAKGTHMRVHTPLKPPRAWVEMRQHPRATVNIALTRRRAARAVRMVHFIEPEHAPRA
jgi:hypothetical protein